MQESFLHHVWQMQYFDKHELVTVDGEPVSVFFPGTLNTNSGPDFFNARLKIGELDWVGHVEIHLRSSGWLDHHHNDDGAFDNVILHVVWQVDREVRRKDGSLLPTIELRGRVEETLVRSYRQLTGSSLAVPCQRSLRDVDPVITESMISRALTIRLERKAADVMVFMEQNENDWSETLYQLLAGAFGFRINAHPFRQLARTVPLRIVLKHVDRLASIEALLLGQAGFLERTKGDEYFLALRREYEQIAHKFELKSTRMTRSQWRFLRLRPANFPPLRLAQFASFLHDHPHFFSEILETESLPTLVEKMATRPSDYWLTHFQLGKPGHVGAKEMGKSSIEMMVINAVVPLLMAYGKRMDDQRYMDRAISFLERIPAEVNSVVQLWRDIGLRARNSSDTQALIELFDTFCKQRNCLHCTIGASLIRPATHDHHSPSS